MPDPFALIWTVEQKWMDRLFLCVKKEFQNIWLPSHDEQHHMRVWQHAKNLVIDTGLKPDLSFLENLILACFFHDIGMVVTLDEDHGKASRKICETFLLKRHTPASFSEALEAIEHHDDKNYTRSKKPSSFLLEYLTIADDLDAFGAIGLKSGLLFPRNSLDIN